MLCFTLQISIKTFPAKFYQISSERARVSPFERNWSFCIKVLIFEQKYQIPQRKVTIYSENIINMYAHSAEQPHTSIFIYGRLKLGFVWINMPHSEAPENIFLLWCTIMTQQFFQTSAWPTLQCYNIQSNSLLCDQ